jgi:hypothetical protein
VNVAAPEVPPPGDGLNTVTLTDSTAAMSAASICACTCVLEANVVGRALPFHRTMDDDRKFVPVTIKVNAAEATTPELGLSEVIVGTGLFGGVVVE